jgi:hypothetical protein
MTEFVDAYSKTTGAKQVVPASWLGRTDAPFDDLVKTPRQKARDTAKAETTKEAS